MTEPLEAPLEAISGRLWESTGHDSGDDLIVDGTPSGSTDQVQHLAPHSL
jgi:hypothetical protein